MGKTAIQWTEHTWNPIAGCSVLSPGCTNCYAMRVAARMEAINAEARHAGRKVPAPHYDGLTRRVNGKDVWTGKVAFGSERQLTEPLRRKKPTVYFVNSMSDLFHEGVPDSWIDHVFAIMALAAQHTFQVLTKRAGRMRDYCSSDASVGRVGALLAEMVGSEGKITLRHNGDGLSGLALPNVWLGVSCERQEEANRRIPLLLETPAAVRFISAEPLLGPVDLTAIDCGGTELRWNCLGGRGRRGGVDWVIVGGESGVDARPMHIDWARSLRDQCGSAGVPFFFKQWGEHVPIFEFGDGAGDSGWGDLPEFAGFRRVGKKAAGRQLDGVEHDDIPQRVPAL